jgi:hypothetical protein
MMHPLFHLITAQPQLVSDHAEAYADLIVEECARVATAWRRSALLNAIALCCLGVAAVLAGVAFMLWAVIPAASIEAPWALLAAPVLPVLLALWCLLASRASGGSMAFDNVRQQLKADMLMLREAGAA